MIDYREPRLGAAGPVSPPAPYKGLAPFEDSELDSLFFFGRARERELIAANLMASPLTILFGPSGVGKSSLLRAGVAYPLGVIARRNLETRGEPEFAVVVFGSWRGDPTADLRNAVTEAVDDLLGEPGDGSTANVSLADAIGAATRRLGGYLYLILDQMEEYFLYHRNDSGAGTLASELPDVVNRRGLRVNVVLAIRDDELAALDALKPRIPNLFANALRLDHLDRSAARAAVLGPLERYNALASGEAPVSAEPALVDAVLEEVATGKIDPGLVGRGAVASGRDGGHVEAPYLQLVMQRLWDVERSEGSSMLRLDTLRRLGGAQQVVEDHLERAMTSLTPHAQDLAATMFAHLVTPSGAKIAHALPDLASYSASSEQEADEVVRSLAEQRILRPLGSAGDGDRRYEIFHDVLGDAVLAWRTRHEMQRNVERERADARVRHRRLTRTVAAALVALVCVGAVAVYALLQRREAAEQAQSAEARELAATAFSQLATDPELSMLLALEATRRERTPRVEEALRRALIESRLRSVVDLGADRRVLAATPLGDSAAVAVADDGLARWFDIESGSVARTASLGGPFRHASFSSDREVLVTVGPGRAVRLWRAATAEPIAAYREPVPVRAAAVSDDGRFIATAGVDRRVRVRTRRAARLLQSFALRPIPTAVALSPDGSRVAVGGTDGATRIWTTREGNSVARFDGHRGWVLAASFNETANLLATGSTDGTARVWNVASLDLVAVMTGHGNFVTSTAFGDGGRVLVTGSRDRTARVWDATSGRALGVLRGHGDWVGTASLDAAGDFAVTSSSDGTARIWDVRTEPRLDLVRRFQAPVTDVRYAASNGPLVAAVGTSAIVVRPRSRDLTLAHEREVAGASVTDDGELAATAAGTQALLWDLTTGRAARVFSHPSSVTAVSLSRDGALLATADTGGVARIWRTREDVFRELTSNAALNDVAFDARGERLVAAGADGVARIWEVRTGKLLRELRGHEAAVTAAEFSGDGRLVSTASADHDGRIWDSRTGRRVAILSGHFGRVNDVAFSGDGRWIATAGPASAALWETPTGELVFYLRGHKGAVTSAAFAGRAYRIVTAGADRTMRSYECDVCGDLDQLSALATERLAETGRALTASERRRFVPGD